MFRLWLRRWAVERRLWLRRRRLRRRYLRYRRQVARYDCGSMLLDTMRPDLARTHKGGAKGARDPATLAYWRKVQKEMAQ